MGQLLCDAVLRASKTSLGSTIWSDIQSTYQAAMKPLTVVSQALLVAQGLAAEPCKHRLTPEKLEAALTSEGLENNLWHLDRIGTENKGNRAFGTPGYKASSDYLLEQISVEGPDADFDIWKQYFNHTYEETREIALTGPDGEDVDVYTLIYNHATPVPDGITAQLAAIPVDDARGSGCYEDQWSGIDVVGKLALVKRGVCSISDKIKLAKSHGALGVVLVHNTENTPNTGTLSADNIGLLVPVGMIKLAVGEAWFARIAGGEVLTVTLLVDSFFEERESWNIFADTKDGDPDSIIVLGAHLDSVPAGPGINDDGSGVTAQIEIAKALRQFRGLKNKIRLAWWGAEEPGLVGSLYYTSHLSEEEADKIRFYFNYDMIGSPVPVYGIYVGDNPDDKVGAQLLLDYLVAKDKPAYFGSFGTGSDYVGFLNLGIASSGVQTGGGIPADPCYHLACDVFGNVNLDPLTVNTKAAAVAAATLALKDELPRRVKTSLNPRSKNRIRAQFDSWRTARAEAVDSHKCAGDSKHTV